MNVIAILTALLTLCLAIIGYFIKSHIETVKQDVRLLRKSVVALKQDSIWLTNTVSELKSMVSQNTKEQVAILSKLSARMNDVRESVAFLQDKIDMHENHLDNYGKIIRVLAKK